MEVNDLHLVEEPKKVLGMNPKKFALWLFIVSIVMIFGSLTSAYVVKMADGEWLIYDLPTIFWINSMIIMVSSAAMQWAVVSARKDNIANVKLALLATIVLGVGFLYGQFQAWKDLVDIGVYFVGNASGSFLYVLTGVHGFHLITGLAFILIVMGAAFRYKVHSRNLLTIEMCATYWHFLGGLWLYLFIFLLLNH